MRTTLNNQPKNGETPYGTIPCQSDMEGVETMNRYDAKELVKLVSYMTMADGGLYLAQKGKYPYFAMNMVTDNMDYILKCKDILENITTVAIYDRKVEGNRRPQVRLSTSPHPFFEPIRNRIYIDNYKGLDPHTLKLMDAEALAILYMCDGSLFVEQPNPAKGLVNPSFNVTLNMKRLSYGDHFLLKKLLKEKFDLEWNINRQYQYYYLRLRTKDVEKFMNIIRPYVTPSFYYKLIASNVRMVDPHFSNI